LILVVLAAVRLSSFNLTFCLSGARLLQKIHLLSYVFEASLLATALISCGLVRKFWLGVYQVAFLTAIVNNSDEVYKRALVNDVQFDCTCALI
jgi:hypothetical protein